MANSKKKKPIKDKDGKVIGWVTDDSFPLTVPTRVNRENKFVEAEYKVNKNAKGQLYTGK